MIINKRERYAIIMLIAIASVQKNKTEYISLKPIASENGLSLKYAEEILRPLKRSGIIEVKRGNGGGYKLTRDPELITILEILPALRRSLKVSKKQGLNEEFWIGLSDTLTSYLNGIHLSTLIEKGHLDFI